MHPKDEIYLNEVCGDEDDGCKYSFDSKSNQMTESRETPHAYESPERRIGSAVAIPYTYSQDDADSSVFQSLVTWDAETTNSELNGNALETPKTEEKDTSYLTPSLNPHIPDFKFDQQRGDFGTSKTPNRIFNRVPNKLASNQMCDPSHFKHQRPSPGGFFSSPSFSLYSQDSNELDSAKKLNNTSPPELLRDQACTFGNITENRESHHPRPPIQIQELSVTDLSVDYVTRSELQNRLEEKEKFIKSLQKKYENALNMIDSLESSHRKHNTAAQFENEKKLLIANETLEDEISELQIKHSDILKKMGAMEDNSELREKFLKEKIEEYELTVYNLKSEVSLVKQENQSKLHKNSTAIEEENESLKIKVNALEAKLYEHRKEKNQFSEIRQELSEAGEKLKFAENEIQQKDEVLIQREKDLENLRIDVNCRTESCKTLQCNINDLEEKIKDMQENFAHRENGLKTLEKELITEKNLNSTLKMNISTLEKRLRDEQNFNESEMDEMSQESIQQKKEIGVLNQNLLLQQEEYTNLLKVCDDYCKNADRLCELINESSEKVKCLQAIENSEDREQKYQSSGVVELKTNQKKWMLITENIANLLDEVVRFECLFDENNALEKKVTSLSDENMLMHKKVINLEDHVEDLTNNLELTNLKVENSFEEHRERSKMTRKINMLENEYKHLARKFNASSRGSDYLFNLLHNASRTISGMTPFIVRDENDEDSILNLSDNEDSSMTLLNLETPVYKKLEEKIQFSIENLPILIDSYSDLVAQLSSKKISFECVTNNKEKMEINIKNLTSKNLEFEETVVQLKSQLKVVSVELESSKALRDEFEDLAKVKWQEYDTKTRSLLVDIETLEKETSNLREELKQQKECTVNVENQLSENIRSRQNLKMQTVKYQAEVDELHRTVTELKNEKQDSEHRLGDIEEADLVNKKDIQHLQEEYQEKEISLLEDIDNLTEALEAQKTCTKNAEIQLSENIRSSQNLEAQVTKYQVEKEGLDRIISELKNEKVSYDHRLDVIRQSNLDVKKVQEKERYLLSDIENLEKEISNLREELQKQKKSAENAENQLSEKNCTTQNLEKQIAEYQAEVDDFHRIVTETKNEKATLEDRMNEARQSDSIAKGELQELKLRFQEKERSLLSDIDCLEEEKKLLRQEIEKQRSYSENSENRLRESIRSRQNLEKDIEKNQTQVNDFQGDLDELKNEKISLEIRLKNERESHLASKAQVEELKDKLDCTKNEIVGVTSRVESQKQIISDLRNSINEVSENFEQDIEKAQREIQKLKNDLSMKKRENLRQENDIKSLIYEAKTNKDESHKLMEEMASLKTRLTGNENLQKENDTLKKEVVELTERLKISESSFSCIENRVESQKKTISALKNDLFRMTEAINEKYNQFEKKNFSEQKDQIQSSIEQTSFTFTEIMKHLRETVESLAELETLDENKTRELKNTLKEIHQFIDEPKGTVDVHNVKLEHDDTEKIDILMLKMHALQNELNESKQLNKILEDEILPLRLNLRNKTIELDEAALTISSMKKKLEEVNKELGDGQSPIKTDSSDFDERSNLFKLEKMERNVQKQKDAMTQNESIILSLQTKIEKYGLTISKHRREQVEMENKISEISKKLDSGTSELKLLVKKYYAGKDTIDSNSIIVYTHYLEQIMDNVEKDFDEFKETVANRDAQITLLNKKLKTSTTTLDESKATISSLQDLVENNKNAHEKNILDMEEEMEKGLVEVKRMAERKAKFQFESMTGDERRFQIYENQRNMKILEDEIEIQKMTVSSLRLNMKELGESNEIEIDRLNSELQKAREELVDLRNKANSTNLLVKKKATENDSQLVKSIEMKSQDLVNQLELNNSLKEEVSHLTSQLSKSDLLVKDTLSSLKNLEEKYLSNLKTNQIKVEELNEEVSRVETLLEAERSRNEEPKNDLLNIQDIPFVLPPHNGSSPKDHAQDDCPKGDDLNGQLRSEVASLKECLSDMEINLSNKNYDLERLHDDFVKASQQLEIAENEVDHRREEMEHLKQINDDLSIEIEKLKQTNESRKCVRNEEIESLQSVEGQGSITSTRERNHLEDVLKITNNALEESKKSFLLLKEQSLRERQSFKSKLEEMSIELENLRKEKENIENSTQTNSQSSVDSQRYSLKFLRRKQTETQTLKDYTYEIKELKEKVSLFSQRTREYEKYMHELMKIIRSVGIHLGNEHNYFLPRNCGVISLSSDEVSIEDITDVAWSIKNCILELDKIVKHQKETISILHQDNELTTHTQELEEKNEVLLMRLNEAERKASLVELLKQDVAQKEEKIASMETSMESIKKSERKSKEMALEALNHAKKLVGKNYQRQQRKINPSKSY